MEFYQKLQCLQSVTLRVYRPMKVLLRPLSQTFWRISKQYFVFVCSPKKNKPTQSATIVLTLWIYRTEDELQSCILVWRHSKGVCTVISRSFARSADIVAWPVQRRFGHRGKFQKLFNDRGEIISNLGYSTSFPSNPKQQSRNRVH